MQKIFKKHTNIFLKTTQRQDNGEESKELQILAILLNGEVKAHTTVDLLRHAATSLHFTILLQRLTDIFSNLQ